MGQVPISRLPSKALLRLERLPRAGYGRTHGWFSAGEDDLHNPFLGRFYKQRARWALACQMQFHQRLTQFAGEVPEKVLIADHTMEKELLFAQVVMTEEEFAIYERYFTRLVIDCGFNPRLWSTSLRRCQPSFSGFASVVAMPKARSIKPIWRRCITSITHGSPAITLAPPPGGGG